MKLLNLGNKKINRMLKELESYNLIYRSHQGLGKPNKIYVYDMLKADNSNWLPKQFKHRKGGKLERNIMMIQYDKIELTKETQIFIIQTKRE